MCLEIKDLLSEADLELVEFYDVTQTKKKVVLDHNYGDECDFKFHLDQEYFVYQIKGDSNFTNYEVSNTSTTIGFISINNNDNSIYILDIDGNNLAVNFGDFVESVFHLVWLGGSFE